MIIEKSDYHLYFHLKKLLEIRDIPKRLYIEGNVELLHREDYKILCLIGSRKCTSYGRDVVERLVTDIAGEKIIILSGLALGIDGHVHKEALKNKLPTIAIPGSGLNRDVLHPQTHVNLANQIVETDNLLISERAPDFKATIWSFPARNRIEAAISDAILIVESNAKSGTQVTARLGLEYNKNIGVIPGSIFSPTSVGTIKLWKQGAMPVCDASDIRELLCMDNQNSNMNSSLFDYTENKIPENISIEEKKILELLSEPMSKERLIADSGLDFTTALITIIQLEAKGHVKEEWGEVRRV